MSPGRRWFRLLAAVSVGGLVLVWSTRLLGGARSAPGDRSGPVVSPPDQADRASPRPTTATRPTAAAQPVAATQPAVRAPTPTVEPGTQEPSEPDVAEEPPPPPLEPRPPDVRSDPARLAARFVAEWLTHPAGLESPSSLAARLADLLTPAYRATIEGLSPAGTEDQAGSVAVMGATVAMAAGVYRVTAWQAPEAGGAALEGPYAWDVTITRDPAAGWLVDGLRRVG